MRSLSAWSVQWAIAGAVVTSSRGRGEAKVWRVALMGPVVSLGGVGTGKNGETADGLDEQSSPV
jgi:hypothetical protein